MTDLLTPEEFADLFASFAHTAFRLETRDFYDEDSEHEPFRRFLAGEPADDSWMADFCDDVRGWVAEGKRIERARVVTVPHSDYVRWSMTVARLNIQAGYTFVRPKNNSDGWFAVPPTGNIDDDWGPGPADSPYRLNIVATGTHEAAHLMIYRPTAYGRLLHLLDTRVRPAVRRVRERMA